MELNLGAKDLIYICINIISVMTVLISLRSRLYSFEKTLGNHDKILSGDKGKLNVIDVAQCKEHRDDIFRAIRRNEDIMAKILKEIEALNKNVLTVMVYLQLKKPGANIGMEESLDDS